MFPTTVKDPKEVIGHAPELLTLEEQTALAGMFIATEVYSPHTLPLRRIRAIGKSAMDCIRQLQEQELDPTEFEFTQLHPPY